MCGGRESAKPVKRCPGRPRKGGSDSKSDSAIIKHLRDSPFCLGVVGKDLKRYFKILSRARRADHLHTLEAVFNAFKKPDLCVQKEQMVKLCLV